MKTHKDRNGIVPYTQVIFVSFDRKVKTGHIVFDNYTMQPGAEKDQQEHEEWLKKQRKAK